MSARRPNNSFKPTAAVGLVHKQSLRVGGGLIQALGGIGLRV
jgi:hypothetical protein